ncbi:hypothetical protein GGS24DRAFT_458663 [Hypoxylon argillaceum]|nr:hypothetical protein GGS24DRAFT_458663 [Hypoxylon argillaceum]
MAKVVEMEAACLSRDIILFAAIISLLYICLHIRGARKNYKREGPGPPQIYGHYLHASALLFARLGIVIWIAALVATAIMMARAIPFQGFLAKVPALNLVLCIGAIPSFLIISVTIERNPTPFATAALSSNSLLTCRVSEYADDLASDLSVSRRSSLKRKGSQRGSVLTLATEDICGTGAREYEAKTQIVGNRLVLLTEKIPPILPKVNLIPDSPIPPIPKALESTPSQAVPQPAYFPGGWRPEWNSAAAEDNGAPREAETPTAGESSIEASQQQQHTAAAPPLPHPLSSHPPYTPSKIPAPNTSSPKPKPKPRANSRPAAAASTSITSSAARSNLSTVRYASQPEIAVRQPIMVVRNPAYLPPSVADEKEEAAAAAAAVRRPDPVALLRSAQRAQKTGGAATGPRRQPSNFSRPTQRART